MCNFAIKKSILLSVLFGSTILGVCSCASLPETSEILEPAAESVAAAQALYAIDNSAETVATAQAIYALDASAEIYDVTSVPVEESVPPQAGFEQEEAEATEEEAVIPVVEPKKVEPRKAYVEPVVKVQVLGGASAIKVGSDDELFLSFSSNAMRVEPNSSIRFKPRSAKVSVRSHSVGIATFDAEEYDEARTLAEEWKRKGYTVRIIKAGGPLVQADGTISDTTVYWVALGRFKDERSAERFKDKMYSWGMSAWVIDESLLGPRGNIEILDEKGNPRAYANSRIHISSDSPIRIYDVPFGHGFWSSGNSEHRLYASPIEIIVDKLGKLAAINEVTVEEYIKGVVPVEIRLAAHDEALKAQAVAARTEALAKLGIQHVYDPFDFCASQHCQEYGGLTRRMSRTDMAVDVTRGQVLMRDDSLIDAVYSANCGGHTEHNENVWSSRPDRSLRGVSDLSGDAGSLYSPIQASQVATWIRQKPRAFCSDPRVSGRNKFRWTIRYSPSELSKTVNRHRRVGDVRDIRILKRGVSGRAMQMQIIGSRDSTIINKELPIRRVLGGLKSSMFIVDIERDSSGNPLTFTFRGGGWGHGVGMCQAGAEGMALCDFHYAEILKHYFAETEIANLYE